MSDKRIVTLSSLNKRSHGGSDDEYSSNDDDRQGLYVGGSEHSGQQVLGPSSGNEAYISRFFDAARLISQSSRSGQDPEQQQQQSSLPAARSMTKSAGITALPYDRQIMGGGIESEGVENPRVTLKVWRNGFTLDDGELRNFTDSENKEFFEDVMSGRTPKELARKFTGRHFDLQVERKPGLYESPEIEDEQHTFSGSGMRLGGIISPVTNGEGSTSSSSGEQMQKFPDVASGQKEVKVNEGEPTTQVQIRLPSGEKIIGRFNHCHTVVDVRSFIIGAVPELAFTPFDLLTTFPTRLIHDEKESLESGNLLNSLITVKLV